jgi:AAA domain
MTQTEDKILDFFRDEKPSEEARAKAAAEDKLPLLFGANPVDYAVRQLNGQNCLLGDRYLSRGGGLLFVAPSGMGKSTAVMQASVLWACGKPAFVINSYQPLRVTIIQAEDDEDDLRDQARVVDHLCLNAAEKHCVAQNCWIETVNDKLGLEAVGIIDGILKQRQTDLLILNPYTAYFDGAIRDDQANRLFLRRDLQRLINRHRIGVILVLHTPKTNFRGSTEAWNIYDWMYSAAGAAELTQWARAVLAIDPVGDSGIFRFIAAKRGERIGWEERIRYFAHDQRPGVLMWNETTEAAAKSAKVQTVSASIEDLLKLVPAIDPIPKAQLEEKARQAGMSRTRFRALLETAFVDKRLFSVQIDNLPARFIAGVSRSPANL